MQALNGLAARIFLALAWATAIWRAAAVPTSRLRAQHAAVSPLWRTGGPRHLVLDAESKALQESSGKLILNATVAKKDRAPTFDDFKGCGLTFQVHSGSDKHKACPDNCPLVVQDKTDEDYCSFRCIPYGRCMQWNPKAPVADPDLHICRPPNPDACEVKKFDGTDSCVKCDWSFELGKDGKCHWNAYIVLGLTLLGLVALVLAFFVLLWIVDLFIRPTTNEHGLQHGLAFRFCQKIQMPLNKKDEMRQLWPLPTNLLWEQVAGPGMTLHFNFQAAIIFWSLCVACLWFFMAVFIDWDLLILGTRKYGTPKTNCVLVMWGHETQQRLMWVKILFLQIVYFGSFIVCILYAIKQLRLFQSLDYKTTTMKDFAALCKGLPEFTGEKKAEDMIRDQIQESLRKRAQDAPCPKVVGVSVCWDCEEYNEKIVQELRKELKDEHCNEAEPEEELNENALRRRVKELENSIFIGEEEEQPNNDEVEGEIKKMLEEMRSTEKAYIIFNSEPERDEAIKLLGEGFDFFQGETKSRASLEEEINEPDTVIWENQSSNLMKKTCKMVKGLICIFLALVFWGVFFYSPYIWAISSFNFENGREPGGLYSMMFTIVVCIGNVIMYEVCARVADMIGYANRDQREQCYMVLYTVSCLCNLLLDMVTTFFMGWQIMVGLGFRLYDGTKLSEVDDFSDRFNSYAMQRNLAENVFNYAFPSTYLIPFLIEPFVTIALPYYLMLAIVRSHRECSFSQAEELLTSPPMDMGRYADVILNVLIAILIFLFPGGNTAKLFFLMALSHIWIYYFDHYRVLRCVENCNFSGMSVDWASQAMMAPACGLILIALVWKLELDAGPLGLVWNCALAFVLHCVVHILLLLFLVPCFSLKRPEDGPTQSTSTPTAQQIEEGGQPPSSKDRPASMTFKELGQRLPCSWFSANPTHCLRSKLIYEDKPHCKYFVSGKEHLLQVNDKIGCHFHSNKMDDDELYRKQTTFLDKDEIGDLKGFADEAAHQAQDFGRRVSHSADPEDDASQSQKGQESAAFIEEQKSRLRHVHRDSVDGDEDKEAKQSKPKEASKPEAAPSQEAKRATAQSSAASGDQGKSEEAGQQTSAQRKKKSSGKAAPAPREKSGEGEFEDAES